MNVKRFVGRNSRDAMARVRAAFGDDAVVLSNRACDQGVEILALPGAAIDTLTRGREPAAAAAREPAVRGGAERARAERAPAERPAAERAPIERAPIGRPAGERRVAERRPAERTQPERDAAPHDPAARAERVLGADRIERAERAERGEYPDRADRMADGPDAPGVEPRAAATRPMSTVSFEDYVRDRFARRQATPQWPEDDQIPVLHEQLDDAGAGAGPLDAAHDFDPFLASPAEPIAPVEPSMDDACGMPAEPSLPAAAADGLRAELMQEMRALRGFIGEQMSSIAWLDGVRRHPQQSRLLRQLLDNGFSAAVTRKLAEQLPADCGEAGASRWLQQVVARNLRSDADGELLARGGVFAVVGPTGVGKTTTTAKIAAQFALRHGTQAIGLITVDHYRIGAHDQLRAFGRILGVPVHTAHDEATLADFLQIFAAKKLVLIDTVGVGQRDERVAELLESLASPAIRKLVVLNAASQAATLEDVVGAYRASEAAGVVISKIDEAVTLGGVVDCVMRHRLRVVGVADGQRVPEDWHAMSADELARRALAERAQSVFTLEAAELPAMWTLPGAVEAVHA